MTIGFGFGFTSDWLKSTIEVMQNQSSYFDTQLKTALLLLFLLLPVLLFLKLD